MGTNVAGPAGPGCYFLFIFEANETFSMKNDTPLPLQPTHICFVAQPKTTSSLREIPGHFAFHCTAYICYNLQNKCNCHSRKMAISFAEDADQCEKQAYG